MYVEKAKQTLYALKKQKYTPLSMVLRTLAGGGNRERINKKSDEASEGIMMGFDKNQFSLVETYEGIFH